MKASALIVLFLCTSLLEASEKRPGTHSWGYAEPVRGNSAAAGYRLSFNTPAGDGAEPGMPSAKRVIYFALRPNEQLRCAVNSYEAVAGPQKTTGANYRYTRDTDTSIIRTVPQTSQEPGWETLSSVPEMIVVRYEWYRGYYLAHIEVSSHIYDKTANSAAFVKSVDASFTVTAPGQPPFHQEIGKKDRRFELLLRDMIINYDDAVPYEQPAQPFAATTWFNPIAQYVKMAIGQDGLYRLSYQQVQSIVPALLTADPRTVQLYTNGVEVPIFVSGETDGVFNTADYIEFPALRNYTYKHRTITTGSTEYNEYLNRITDSTIYWLTFGIRTGLRMGSNPAVIQTADTLRAYTDFRHIESNSFLQYSGGDIVMQQNPLWTSGDIWGWTFINANGNLTSPFSVSDVAPNGDSLRAYAKFVSWGANIDANAHTVSVRVNNGADLGMTTINRYGQAVISGAVPVSLVKDNSSNTVGIYSKPTAATTVNSIIPDWLEVEYPRFLKAINDSLLFDFRSLTSRGLRAVQLTNFSSRDIAIYKIKPVVEKISNVSFSSSAPYAVVFVDTVGPQEQYIAIANNRPLQPFIKKTKKFQNISSDRHQTDYLIVTHNKFRPEAEQYGRFVASTKAMTTRVIDVEDIFDEYGYGYPTPESMRDYFQSSLAWNGPVPSFLFLIGDASYDTKYYYGNRNAQNYVPSYGYPVSDPLLVTFDSLSPIPQMYVGRLPVNNIGEATSYLNRMQTYLATPNSEWNKRYLFFSGGDPTIPGQVGSFIDVNNFVLNNYVRPAPVGGEGTHFYKTTNPQSDFGPYTAQQIKDAIAFGGVFISYIGHSGTQTWDNSIGDPVQLQNNQGKFPLITDFGCSTGKFAEPQVTSFSELFVLGPTSSAIGYIGNSALGFASIATQLPLEFYRRICKDSIRTLGTAHLKAKAAMALSSFSSVNSVMLYTNTLIGDPALDLAIPAKPNLVVNPSEIIAPGSVTEASDSVGVKIFVMNFGSVISDSVEIRLEHRFGGQLINSTTLRRRFPVLSDSILYQVNVKNRPGEHTITVTADPANLISELSESDNTAQKSMYVLSTSFKTIQPIERNNGIAEKIVLLNPFARSKDTTQAVVAQIDTTDAFTSGIPMTSRMDILTTEFKLNPLPLARRYWWRAKLNTLSSLWTIGTFYQGNAPGTIIGQTDALEWANNTFSNTVMEVQASNAVNAKLQTKKIVLRAISSGGLDGSFGIVEINGFNVIENSFGVGHSLVVLDTTDYSVIKKRTFDLYNQPSNADSLVSFIKAIPNGLIVVAIIIDEGSNNFTSAARAAYSSIGATQANRISWRDSWAVIGKKGGARGSALEMYKPSTTGKAIVDTTFTKIETAGSIITPEIGPVAEWKTLTIEKSAPSGSRVNVTVMGVGQKGNIDSLLASDSSSIDLKKISAVSYPKIKLRFDLQANASYQSPVVSSWSAGITSPAELATNYQAVKGYVSENGAAGREIADNDTVSQGEKILLTYRVYNVGGANAKKIPVRANSLWDNNNNELIASTVIDSIPPQSYKEVSALYNTSLGSGRRSIRITIDPDTLIRELYKDNNIYEFPIYVKKDSSKPLLPNLFITQKNIYPIIAPVTDEKDSARFAVVYGNSGAFINDSVTISIRQFYQGANVTAWSIRRKYPQEMDTVFITVPILKRAGEHQIKVELDPVGLITESSESDNTATYYFTVVTTDFKILQPTSFSTGSVSKIIFLNPTSSLGAASKIADLELDTLADLSAAKKVQLPMQEFTTSYDITALPRPDRYYWRIKQEQSGKDWTTGSFYLGESAAYSIGQSDSTGWKGNAFVHAAYNGSGAHIADTRTRIRAVSAGFSDGRTGSIEINGTNVLPPVFGTGHNVVVIDTGSFAVAARRRFDISNTAADADSLVQFLSSVASGSIVADVVVDEGANNLTPAARDALRSIGSASIDRLTRRDSWAIIGRKGAAIGSVPESYVPQFGGAAAAETTFIRKEFKGAITTQPFGPLSRLSAFSMTGSIPGGTSVQTQFVGTRYNKTIDTLLLTSGTALSNSGIQNSASYQEGKIIFTLQTTGPSSPSIAGWKLSAMPFTELAVSEQDASVSRSQVMEGEPVIFTGKIFNVSSASADSVTVQLSTNDGGFEKILKMQKFALIAAYDSAVFSYTYATKGRRGSQALTLKIDPADSLLEASKDNNVVSVSFAVQSDTLRPEIQIAVDGERVLDGDYIRQHPEIVIRYSDNNPSAITAADTGNFRIRLNNYPVYFIPGVAELLPSTVPGQAQLKWTPTLPDGENFIQIYALDVTGNASDTTTLFVNVSSDFVLKDVYNLPNPFVGSTDFTFNILSPVNPDEVAIKIFTVAGRLIQDLSFQGKIGFNRFYWNGRDKDGDDIANGVYFYKVIVKQADKQTNAISKLVKMR